MQSHGKKFKNNTKLSYKSEANYQIEKGEKLARDSKHLSDLIYKNKYQTSENYKNIDNLDLRFFENLKTKCNVFEYSRRERFYGKTKLCNKTSKNRIFNIIIGILTCVREFTNWELSQTGSKGQSTLS